jgi:hypothetical protein
VAHFCNLRAVRDCPPTKTFVLSSNPSTTKNKTKQQQLQKTWCLQTTEIYSLMVLEARSQNQGTSMALFPPQALRENFFLASSGFW